MISQDDKRIRLMNPEMENWLFEIEKINEGNKYLNGLTGIAVGATVTIIGAAIIALSYYNLIF